RPRLVARVVAVDVDHAEVAARIGVVGLVALEVGADDEFADLAEQGERLAVVGVHRKGVLLQVACGVGQVGHAGAGVASGEGIQVVGGALGAAHGDAPVAAVVEAVGQLGDGIGAAAVEVAPVGAQVGRAAEVPQTAVGGGGVAV